MGCREAWSSPLQARMDYRQEAWSSPLQAHMDCPPNPLQVSSKKFEVLVLALSAHKGYSHCCNGSNRNPRPEAPPGLIWQTIIAVVV